MSTDKFQVVGVESSDGDPCDCCGTTCPRRRVVMKELDTMRFLRLGSSCAARQLLGSTGPVSNPLGVVQDAALDQWNREFARLHAVLREEKVAVGLSETFNPGPSWWEAIRMSPKFSRLLSVHKSIADHNRRLPRFDLTRG